MTPLDQLRDAVQAWVRADTGEDRILTAFVITAETVTLDQPDENYIDSAGQGSYATRVGLSTLLHDDLLQGDDE